MHILSNISSIKSNQAMKFGQLIHYNMRIIFLENYTQNVMKKLFPDPFLQNQNWKDLRINSLYFYSVYFTASPS